MNYSGLKEISYKAARILQQRKAIWLSVSMQEGKITQRSQESKK
jgi:hypothetical protein